MYKKYTLKKIIYHLYKRISADKELLQALTDFYHSVTYCDFQVCEHPGSVYS